MHFLKSALIECKKSALNLVHFFVEFNPRTAKDVVLNLLAEQKMDLMEEAITLKRDLKGAFEQIDINMKDMKEEADRKDIVQTEAIKALSLKLENFENNPKYASLHYLAKWMHCLNTPVILIHLIPQ